MVTSYYVSVFVIYMLFVFGLGIYLSRWVKSEGDYWVANRQLSGFVGGCSIAATQMSAGSVIGSVGLWYGIGWAWIWVWPLISVGYIIAVELVGRRTGRRGSTSCRPCRQRTRPRRGFGRPGNALVAGRLGQSKRLFDTC